MRIELFGSFAIFLMAPVLFGLEQLAAAADHNCTPVMVGGGRGRIRLTYVSDFLVGTDFGDAVRREQNAEILQLRRRPAMGLAGIYLFCFSAGENHLIHAPIKALLPAGETAHFVWDASAALIIMVLLGNPLSAPAYSRKTWAIWLGLLVVSNVFAARADHALRRWRP